MLQIENLDESKSEWHLNETHIVIPMIEGDILTNKDSDKLTSTITLNTLEGTDHAILTNGLEHSLVIGLDRNLFETHNSKSDLLVIQNSDLKLLPCNTDIKNPVAFTLSNIDHDRNEILWESSLLKDKKPEWGASDKTIFEVKDALNYDDSVQDTSKTWQDDSEKSNGQISLDEMGNDLTKFSVEKIDGSVLIPVEESLIENKKTADFIVNYYPNVQNNEMASLLSNSVVCNKSDENEDQVVITKSRNFILNGHPEKYNKVDLDFPETQETFNAEQLDKSLVEMVGHQSKIIFKPDMVTSSQTKQTKEQKFTNRLFIKEVSGIKSCLPEKSLPLKKKAKMKRTMVSVMDNSKVFKLEVPNPYDSKSSNDKRSKPALENIIDTSSDSDEPLINRVKKKKKVLKNSGTSTLMTGKEKLSTGETPSNESNDKTLATKFPYVNENKFNNIYDLIDDLKKCRLINTSVWELLKSGLEEMDTNILEEMNSKINNGKSSDCDCYSPQLKAFALVLYFKQPAAFNHLVNLYKNGWPSLNAIKEWKRRLNRGQRKNFNDLTEGNQN